MNGAFMWLADMWATGFIALTALFLGAVAILATLGAFGMAMVHTIAAARRYWPVTLLIVYSVLAYALK